MALFPRIHRRLRALFWRRRAEAEMAEEMRFHLEQRAADYASDGLTEAEARWAAERRFGNPAVIQEEARDTFGWGALERFLKDLRLALRQLVKAPGFALLSIVTLALGVGANTSMFSVLNSILLKPLPYADSARLDRIYRTTPQNPTGGVSPADFLDLRRAQNGYGVIAAYTAGDASLSEPGQPAEMAYAIRVTANFLSTLGVQPQLGRDFRPGEDIRGNDRIVILSQRCWLNRFGGRPNVIGRTIRIDGEPHEIVGVLPATFNDWRHLGWVDLIRPLAFDRTQSANRRDVILQLIGRRSGGLSHTEAEKFIGNFGARLAADYPEVNSGSSWRAVSLNATVAGPNGPQILAMLVGLSGFVLLIACSNLANLLLARTMARAREFAVRSALGASRTQLLRPLVAESLLLAFAGGGGAILVARWVAAWLAVRSTADNGERVFIAFDWHVLAWALGASLATAVAFGLAPALFALRLNLNETLKSGARGMTGGHGQRRFRQALIIGQFALAMVLLAGAAVFIRGLHDLNLRRSGWESDRLVTGTVLLPAAVYSDAAKITAFQRSTDERLQALPGVASVSLASAMPFSSFSEVHKFLVEGRELPQPGHEPAAVTNNISPSYFGTLNARLLAGRVFNTEDTATSPKVFIINQTMAAGLFGKENPIGRRIALAGTDSLHWGEIVGVVADTTSVLPDPGPVTYQLFQCMAQEPRLRYWIAVRSAGVAPALLVDGIRSVIANLDPDLPVRKLQPADTTIYRVNYQLGVLRDMLSTFALLGLGLAALGIYGVITRTMAQRTGEFAIRLALGARMGDITRIVLGSGVKLAAIGSGIGFFGALGIFRVLAAGFPGMRFDQAPAIVGTTAFLVTIALVACYLPARHASRINAVEALRLE